MPALASLITGRTSGIGKATAKPFHQREYQVTATGQNPDTIATAEKELTEGIVVVRVRRTVTGRYRTHR
jgi:NADP-dependent 3-hydroxy acid dehydrogenase YdfG